MVTAGESLHINLGFFPLSKCNEKLCAVIPNGLVLAGQELIFLTVFCMGLCLEFVLSTNH